MNIYKLLQRCEHGDVELAHSSICYPSKFERKINDIAGEKITKEGPPISFMPGFRNSFCIKGEKMNIFVDKVIPVIGFKFEDGCNLVWDKDEICWEI
jgi:hypothetical protein